MPAAQESANLLRDGMGNGDHGEFIDTARDGGVGQRRKKAMPGTIDYSKLRIIPDFDTREWWEGTKQHKYLVRQCKVCGHKWFPPTLPACSKCTSMDIGWFETKGRGVLYSYVVIEQ